MKIAVDIDEVLRELVGGFCEYHNKIYGTNFSYSDFKGYSISKTFGITSEESHRRLDDYCLSEDFQSVNLIPHTSEIIPILGNSHELVAITAAPAWMKDLNLEFFEKHFPGCFSDLLFSGEHFPDNCSKTKDEICKDLGIGIIIEDNVFAQGYAENGLKVLLLDKTWNQEVEHENIIRCTDWKEILGEIRGMESGS
jgi:uncharacterized protein